MSAFDVISLSRFESFGGFAEGYSFDDFQCPLNEEVETFLKRKALQSEKLGGSRSYLVLRNDELLGYFTLVLKSFSVPDAVLSKSNRKLISRFARLDAKSGCYHAAVYLIAQIGKNFAIAADRRIKGRELLSLAFDKLRIAQDAVGGKLVMVEREFERPALLEFYNANNFKSWNRRADEGDGVIYDQMLCVLEPNAN